MAVRRRETVKERLRGSGGVARHGDHAGHLIGDRFGGSPELDNLVSQAQRVNSSEYKAIFIMQMGVQGRLVLRCNMLLTENGKNKQ